MLKKRESVKLTGIDIDASVPKLVLYVCPYYKVAFPNLDQIPSDVEQALLAFGGPDVNSTVTVNYLFSSGRTLEQIKQRIQTVKSNGTVVGLSIIENPQNQWPQVCKTVFAENLKKKADELGLDYVFNIDAESSTATAQDYIDLIMAIRKVMPNAVINYVTYSASDTDRQVLASSAAEELQLLMTMSYADSFDSLKQEYLDYRAMNKDIPIATGVKQGAVSESVIEQMCNWTRPDGSVRRMMLWNANRQGAEYGNPGPAFGIYRMMQKALNTPTVEERMLSIKARIDNLESVFSTRKPAKEGLRLAPDVAQVPSYSSLDEKMRYLEAKIESASKHARARNRIK